VRILLGKNWAKKQPHPHYQIELEDGVHNWDWDF